MSAVHPLALCDSELLGPGTTVHAFARVSGGVSSGAGCDIGDHAFLDEGVELGQRVRIGPGARIQRGAKIHDDSVIGPNAVVLPGIIIGRNAVIEGGAVVTRAVPPNAMVAGNPATLRGYVGGETQSAPHVSNHSVEATRVPGAAIHRLKVVDDMRGALMVGEVPADLPFTPRRFFVIYDVPFVEARGEHAHHRCHQFLICLHGQVSALVDDGAARQEVLLDRPSIGLYVPPLVWGSQYGYSKDAKLLVFASEPYDASDYIRFYDEFLNIRRTASPA